MCRGASIGDVKKELEVFKGLPCYSQVIKHKSQTVQDSTLIRTCCGQQEECVFEMNLRFRGGTKRKLKCHEGAPSVLKYFKKSQSPNGATSSDAFASLSNAMDHKRDSGHNIKQQISNEEGRKNNIQQSPAKNGVVKLGESYYALLSDDDEEEDEVKKDFSGAKRSKSAVNNKVRIVGLKFRN